MHSESLKKRILVVIYILSLVALGWVVLHILSYIGAAVMVLACSVLLAYLLKPLVTMFHRPMSLSIPRRFMLRQEDRLKEDNYVKIHLRSRGLSWGASIIVVFVCLIVVAVLVVSLLVPPTVREFRNFVSNGLPLLRTQITTRVADTRAWLSVHLPKEAAEAMPEHINQAGEQVSAWATSSVRSLPPLMGRFVGGVVLLFFVPVLTFYLLLDIDTLYRGFLVMFPVHRRDDVRELAGKIDEVLGRYIRGQLLVAVIVGTAIAIVLKSLGLPYAIIIGCFAGTINLIPYVGTPLGMIPAFLIAVFMPVHGGVLKGFIVLFSMYCVFLTEGKVIVPTVVGKSVGLPPLIIFFSLIVGAELLGLPGMFLAVPTASITRVVIAHYIDKRDREDSNHPSAFAKGRTLPLQEEFIERELQRHSS